MIDANHPYTLHDTYTGAGCALCGKPESEHTQDYILVNGKKEEKGENK